MTPEQHASIRAGCITGSRIASIMNGSWQTWNTLALEMREAKPVVIGQITANMPKPLKHGIVFEKMAVAKFWQKHPEFEMTDPRWVPWFQKEDQIHRIHCGCSPDRMLEKDGVTVPLEIKCPYDPDVHQKYRNGYKMPLIHWPQVAWEMMVSDAPSAWFVSFDPREKSEQWGWFEIQIERDHEYDNFMMEKVNRFLETYMMGDKFTAPNPTEAHLRRIFS